MGACSKCGVLHERDQRYCNLCHAAYMREWRKSHPLNDIQRLKNSARSYARVYKRRGVLVPELCESCGANEVEMHHEDYSQPLKVNWLCRPCHGDIHGFHVPRSQVFSPNEDEIVREPISSLGRWMKKNRHTDQTFARLLRPHMSASVMPATVYKWRRLKNMPRREAIIAIMKVTNNEVSISDFVEPTVECA